MVLKNLFTVLTVVFCLFAQNVFASDPHNHGSKEEKKDVMGPIMHHIGDANEFHLFGDVSIPLPCIAYSEDGVMFTMSSAFEHGHKAVNGYVLHHGVMMRVLDLPAELKSKTVEVHFGSHTHTEQHVDEHGVHEHAAGEDHGHDAHMVTIDGHAYKVEKAGSLQNAGSSWQDFSITKNVFGMLLALVILLILFSKVAKGYAQRQRQAPKGVQSLLEVIIVYMRDEVVKPNIGAEWRKFFPFVMSLFFFILVCNLLGLIPFFPGSANITGNIGVTMVLAIFTFIIVSINGNKHYWEHIFWMPGVPVALKPALAILEFVGIFIKPITLMIRLFANITAGHIIILSLVSLIFVFSGFGESTAGAAGGIALSMPFVFALNMLELFVAFLQAFIFTLLTCLYIGSAVEDHHHEEAHH